MLYKEQATQTEPSQAEGQANLTPSVTSDLWESNRSLCWTTLPFECPPAIHAWTKGTCAHQNAEHAWTSLLQEQIWTQSGIPISGKVG